MIITPLPKPPSTERAESFGEDADRFLASFPLLVSQIDTFGKFVEQKSKDFTQNTQQVQSIKESLQSLTNTMSAKISLTNEELDSKAGAIKSQIHAYATSTANEIVTNKLEAISLLGFFAYSTTENEARCEFIKESNRLNFYIPKGAKGDKGDSYKPNAVGLYSERSNYEDEPKDFSFLATDRGKIYFKTSATTWSTGINFGKGDKGDKGASITNVEVKKTANITNVKIYIDGVMDSSFDITDGQNGSSGFSEALKLMHE